MCARGSEKSSATLELEYRVSDEQAAQLARWAKRYDNDEDISTSKCMSLACYTYSQCISHAIKHPTAQVLDCGPPTTWPADGRLYAALGTGEGTRTILLSPPFDCTADQRIDLSKLMRPGKHIIRLFQHRDYSEYVFIVELHAPTAYRLEALRKMRASGAEWRKFVQECSVFEMKFD